jgi:predicted GIY-YIG superfamily endonuclease
LVYLEEFENRSLAMKREYFLKSAEGGRSKPELIANFDKALLDKYQINYDL